MVTVKYILSLPAQLTLSDVCSKFKQLQSFCKDQAFSDVSEIKLNLSPKKSSHLVFPGLKPISAVGFECMTGGGPLLFWLYQYPVYRKTPIPWVHHSECWADSHDPCFIARHTAIIRALEYAESLGIKVDVKDMAGFWRSKDRKKLDKIRKELSSVNLRINLPTEL